MFSKMYKKEDLKDVKHIGVIMFGLLGDVILRTPVTAALKDLYPNATITCIVDPIGADVLENNNDVDNIIVINRKKESNKFTQNIKKIKTILRVRSEKFDLLVNLYNSGLSRPIVFFSSAQYKLGFCQQKNKYIYNVENICDKERLKANQTLSLYMMSIVEPLSTKVYSLKPIFQIEESSRVDMLKYLQSFSIALEKMYILNLGSGGTEKILDNEKYFYIVEYMYKNYGYPPVIISNPGQEYLQENFINKYMNKSDIPFVRLKTLALKDIAALLELSTFFVTPDTGLMHLAIALDKYIYTVFTYTHPVFVDPCNEKFISVYEKFDEGKLHQKQEISEQTLKLNIELLINKLSSVNP